MEYKCKFQVSGKVLEVGEIQSFASGFTKRDVVIALSQSDQYPNPTPVSLRKDACRIADAINVGDAVTASGYIEGRRYDGPKGTRYFVELNAKEIVVTDKAEPAAKPNTASSWAEILKLGAAYGEGEDAVKARAKALGKAFKAITADDWKKLAAEIVAAHATEGEDDFDEPDDMPF